MLFPSVKHVLVEFYQVMRSGSEGGEEWVAFFGSSLGELVSQSHSFQISDSWHVSRCPDHTEFQSGVVEESLVEVGSEED